MLLNEQVWGKHCVVIVCSNEISSNPVSAIFPIFNNYLIVFLLTYDIATFRFCDYKMNRGSVIDTYGPDQRKCRYLA